MVTEASWVASVMLWVANARTFPTFKTDVTTKTDSSFRFTLSPALSFSFRTLHDFILADFLKIPFLIDKGQHLLGKQSTACGTCIQGLVPHRQGWVGEGAGLEQLEGLKEIQISFFFLVSVFSTHSPFYIHTREHFKHLCESDFPFQ